LWTGIGFRCVPLGIIDLIVLMRKRDLDGFFLEIVGWNTGFNLSVTNIGVRV
jgi:hypothetical protein